MILGDQARASAACGTHTSVGCEISGNNLLILVATCFWLVTVSPIARSSRGLIMKSQRRRRVTAIDKHIGHRLRTRRLMLDMTQSDLARLIGLTFQQLQKY